MFNLADYEPVEVRLEKFIKDYPDFRISTELEVVEATRYIVKAYLFKDEQAIIAATAKLNADLKVLGALGMQNVKLQDIKSILDSLKPKDLINIANLEEALRLLAQINLASTGSKTTAPPPAPDSKRATIELSNSTHHIPCVCASLNTCC